MPTLQALQHLYSSVERGYRPEPGRGFQTVAVSRELAGTDDLKLLERAAFYAVRRRATPLPVKEAYFKLPSGRVAIGRTVDWGMDSLGREGNYLAHHLILDAEAFRAAGADAFAVLDAAQPAAPGTDLTPRDLLPLELNVSPRLLVPPDPDTAEPDLLAVLAYVLARPESTTEVLLGDQPALRVWLRALFAALQIAERERATFCTHFYETANLRDLFRVAVLGSRDELSPKLEGCRIYDPSARKPTGPDPKGPQTPYEQWLSEVVGKDLWEEVPLFQAELSSLRESGSAARLGSLSAGARGAVWSLEGERVPPALQGNPELIAAFFEADEPLSIAEEAASKLLASSPATLCGSGSPEACLEALAALREAGPPRDWKGWLKKHRSEPLVQPFLGDIEPLWKKLRSKLPGSLGRTKGK
jgi:hypothetical protein